MGHPEPPSAREVAHLKPTDSMGAFYTALCLTLTGAGVALTQACVWGHGWLDARAIWPLWFLGHVILSFGLLQAFVLLHECGHGVLFRSRRLNTLTGHVFGALCFIPYRSWVTIHSAHHKWTGWQDLDPTTESLVPRPLGNGERLLMNTCWRFWIPSFSIVYRVSNFWNFGKLSGVARTPGDLRAMKVNAAALALLYAGLLFALGPKAIALGFLPGVLLSLVMLDPIMLSQHSHIPLELSHGEDVRAIRARDQEVYTRSLRFPDWFSRYVLVHFDAHELHHIYPQLPGYRLRQIDYAPGNEAHWLTWILKARRMPAETLLFKNRRDTGSDV
jgi:fatty acid desaturase